MQAAGRVGATRGLQGEGSPVGDLKTKVVDVAARQIALRLGLGLDDRCGEAVVTMVVDCERGEKGVVARRFRCESHPVDDPDVIRSWI